MTKPKEKTEIETNDLEDITDFLKKNKFYCDIGLKYNQKEDTLFFELSLNDNMRKILSLLKSDNETELKDVFYNNLFTFLNEKKEKTTTIKRYLIKTPFRTNFNMFSEILFSKELFEKGKIRGFCNDRGSFKELKANISNSLNQALKSYVSLREDLKGYKFELNLKEIFRDDEQKINSPNTPQTTATRSFIELNEIMRAREGVI